MAAHRNKRTIYKNASARIMAMRSGKQIRIL